MFHQPPVSGTIMRIHDCGTIIMLYLQTAKWLTPVFFDHSPFRWLLEAEGCTPDQLIGRAASFDGQVLRLLDGR